MRRMLPSARMTRRAAPTASAPARRDEMRAWVASNLTPGGIWLAGLVTLVFAVPGPADRFFWAVKLSRESNAPQGAVFSIVDVLLVTTLVYAGWRIVQDRSRIRWLSLVPLAALLGVAIVFSMVSLANALG